MPAAYPGEPQQLYDKMPLFFNSKTGKSEYAFFPDRDIGFLHALARKLEKQTFPAGEFIITEGEPGFNMYLVYSGSVEVCVGQEMRKVKILQRGSLFGEMALFGFQRRTSSVIARETTVCLVMKKRCFQAVLTKYPAEKEYFSNIAETRRQELQAKRKGYSLSSRSSDDSSDSDGDRPPHDPYLDTNYGYDAVETNPSTVLRSSSSRKKGWWARRNSFGSARRKPGQLAPMATAPPLRNAKPPISSASTPAPRKGALSEKQRPFSSRFVRPVSLLEARPHSAGAVQSVATRATQPFGKSPSSLDVEEDFDLDLDTNFEMRRFTD
mmetsp:Transcript_76948/g.135604  ORF Transcript_76948/g.135604 Transcript_76948/m.135604 type:complete len:324 (-) Transcript_76948:39-1010(-)